jgi:seryl-tRNA synthetase
VDAVFRSWAAELGAQERDYPSLIELNTLSRAGQLRAFPQLLAVVGRFHDDEPRSAVEARLDIPRPNEPQSSNAGDFTTTGNSQLPIRNSGYAVTPAVCYHAYAEHARRTLGSHPTVLTMRGRCHRVEREGFLPLERLWEFTMREIVVMGSRDDVEDARQSLIARVTDLVRQCDLDGSIVMAADPFFAAASSGARLLQRLGALKYELRLLLDRDGRSTAVASFNHHQDHFGRSFGITQSNGRPAHSGCVAFGLERWLLALSAQLGTDERSWPPRLREAAGDRQ